MTGSLGKLTRARKSLCFDSIVKPALQINQRSHTMDNPAAHGPLSIDLASHEVRLGEAAVALTAKEFDLLAFLARSPRQVFSRAQLRQGVWGSSPRWQDDKTVAEHVHRVRRKLATGAADDLIQTVRGVGYKVVALDSPTEPALRGT